ncbi:DUF5658 family protein [Aneurinibacillus sp. UBA3580]|jgi:hypothetical protein|uniref:DUF5658 family protein n=1 Tax=Aneurinibacillus sp. UBA3580 TaxID=1946041 RepID=UPI0025801555|nr:DUF5658 family protein [Aneurinibacillus sp. UBA3580]
MIRSLTLYQRLLLYLLLLNLADWYFTCYGIRNQYIQEANPLLSDIITTDPLLVLLWKCAGPLILLYLLPHCRSSWVQHALLFTVCLYSMVNLYHLVFFCLYIV